MKIRHILLVAGSVLILAACSGSSRTTKWGAAPTQWDHTQRSQEQKAADQAECRRRAVAQVEREITSEGPFANEQRDTRLQQMFDRHDQAAHQRDLYDNCMRDKGYVPVVLEGR